MKVLSPAEASFPSMNKQGLKRTNLVVAQLGAVDINASLRVPLHVASGAFSGGHIERSELINRQAARPA